MTTIVIVVVNVVISHSMASVGRDRMFGGHDQREVAWVGRRCEGVV